MSRKEPLLVAEQVSLAITPGKWLYEKKSLVFGKSLPGSITTTKSNG